MDDAHNSTVRNYHTIEQGISELASFKDGDKLADYTEFMFFIEELLDNPAWQEMQCSLSDNVIQVWSTQAAEWNGRGGDVKSIQASRRGVCLAVIVADNAIPEKVVLDVSPIATIYSSTSGQPNFRCQKLYELSEHFVHMNPYAKSIIERFIDKVEPNIDVQRQCMFSYFLALMCIEYSRLNNIEKINEAIAKAVLNSPPSQE